MSETEAQAAEVEQPATPDAEPEVETAAAENTAEAAADAVDPRVQKANKEAQRYRQELRAAQEQLKAAELEKLSESERAVKRAEDAEARAAALETVARQNSIKAEALALGVKHGAVDPQAVIALAADQITFDESGQPDNLNEVFEAAKAERPYLFAQAKTTPSAGAVPGAGAPNLPPEKEETTREKRARLNGANKGANMLEYDTAIRSGAEVTYDGKNILRRYTPEETRRFLESQRGSSSD